ncbi:hypothetical protein [Listeria immobilis]|uniref:Uncharacterized protein n=1 Tax=Listeria immobilis TaxID=2713502 RepID=A0ABR6SUN6_9LIST|nr:hypothetical protein [Listeria immobilis]MBC1509380.1 hypothetical protein [Listeria immobilis]MBC6312085.1 hypothetical protein [Listeria immobilis]
MRALSVNRDDLNLLLHHILQNKDEYLKMINDDSEIVTFFVLSDGIDDEESARILASFGMGMLISTL